MRIGPIGPKINNLRRAVREAQCLFDPANKLFVEEASVSRVGTKEVTVLPPDKKEAVQNLVGTLIPVILQKSENEFAILRPQLIKELNLPKDASIAEVKVAADEYWKQIDQYLEEQKSKKFAFIESIFGQLAEK